MFGIVFEEKGGARGCGVLVGPRLFLWQLACSNQSLPRSRKDVVVV